MTETSLFIIDHHILPALNKLTSTNRSIVFFVPLLIVLIDIEKEKSSMYFIYPQLDARQMES